MYDWLKGFWDSLSKTLGGWVRSLWDMGDWILNGVLEGIWAIVDYCLGMVWDFFYYIYGLFLGENGCVWYLFDFVIWAGWEFLSYFPDMEALLLRYADSFDYVAGWFGMLDVFFPVTETFTLGIIFGSFMLGFLIVKAVLKLIPMVG
jgi:hypothetical protein